jgi:hypothetical protein
MSSSNFCEVPMNEAQYQAKLIKKLKRILPGCIILKNDPGYMPGVPDILILFRSQWAMLEVKMYVDSHFQPNQEYYVGLLNDMSFASFINPQIEEDVLYDLQQSFGLVGSPRIS